MLEHPDWRPSADVRALTELAGEVEAQTQLTASVDRDEYLNGSGWMDSPIVLTTSAADFAPTAAEVENLGRYLVSGGFAYVEVVGINSFRDLEHGRLYDLISLRNLVEAALTGQGLHRGTDWDIEPLPLSHPLFSCYHQIVTMPRHYWAVVQSVITSFYGSYRDNPDRFGWLGQAEPYLEGIFVQGRLAGIYSRQNYRDMWSRRLERTLTSSSELVRTVYQQHVGNRFSGDPALRLGINIVVYALTQEGSLARQYVAR